MLPIRSTAIDTTNNKITINNCCGAGNEIQDGGLVTFAQNYSNLPASTTAGCPGGQGHLVEGMPYYAHVLDPSDFEVFCNGPSGSSNGVQMTFNDQGSGSNLYVTPYPRTKLHEIIFRTSTPDDQFTPAAVRTGPAWASKMAVLQMPARLRGYNPGVESLFLFTADTNVNIPHAKMRFMGIEFTVQDSPEAHQSTDSPAYNFVFDTGSNGTAWPNIQDIRQDVGFDRCYWHFPDTPTRIGLPIGLNGVNVYMRDSYMDGFEFYHGSASGFGTSATGQTLTINAGTQPMNGTMKASTSATATITVSGTGSGNAYAFMDFSGNLNVSLPPGETGTCSGISNCYVFTGDSEGGGGETSGHAYYVDPIYSTSNACTSTETIFTSGNGGVFQTTDSTVEFSDTASDEIGTRFTANTNGYICGVRFLKPADDSAVTSHTVHLNNDSGTVLTTGSTSSETSSGWQTATFASPYAITAGTVYKVTYVTVPNSDHWYFHPWLFRNFSFGSQHVKAIAQYQADNGNGCAVHGSWPTTYLTSGNWGDESVGMVACATITGGSFTSAQTANFWTQGDSPLGHGNGEGGSIDPGLGPGPYQLIDNYFEGAPNIFFHFDDGGGLKVPRQGYLIERNYFTMNFKYMDGSPTSDGLEYIERQPLEWKAGQNILVKGNTFNQYWNEHNPLGVAICLTARGEPGIDRDWTISDVDVESNIAEHGPGFIYGPAIVYGGTAVEVPDMSVRARIHNNLAYDMDDYTYTASDKVNFGEGTFTQSMMGSEDQVIDHNTVISMKGPQAIMFGFASNKTEGVQITSNLLNINGPSPTNAVATGILAQINSAPFDPSTYDSSCAPISNTFQPGELAAACLLPGVNMSKNVLLPSLYGASQANVQSWWPQSHAGISGNYIPAATNQFTDLGMLNWDPTSVSNFQSGLMGNNFGLKSGSEYSGGGADHGLDGADIGVNWNQLGIDQGWVSSTTVAASTITGTTATVSFIAPDGQACPVDYSATDSTLINSFTRVQDTSGPGRQRQVPLTGLSPHTRYTVRINCQTQQPIVTFYTTQ